MSLARAISKLTIGNLVIFAGGFLTGPIIAQALGPAGRGQLTAVIAPLALIPIVAGLGIASFTTREIAAGAPVAKVLRTVIPISLGLGLVGATAGWFLADVLSEGNDTVEMFLRIGSLLAPVSLVIGVLQAVLAGQQRWNRLAIARVIPTLVAVVTIPALYVLDELTVATAAAVTIIGGLAAIVPTLSLLRATSALTWSRANFRRAASFGARAWAAGLANMANFRLDQVLMITLTTDTQLGLYAVAVTVAGASASLPAAVSAPVQARVAAGDRAIVTRATRTSMTLVTLLHVVVAALAIPLIMILFGDEFAGSIPMIWVLLVAGIPFAGGILLSAAIVADGAPGRTATAQFVALGVTIPLLLVLVPAYGGTGAALTSVVTYSVALVVLARTAVRRGLAAGHQELFVPTRQDGTWLIATVRGWWQGRRARGRREAEPRG